MLGNEVSKLPSPLQTKTPSKKNTINFPTPYPSDEELNPKLEKNYEIARGRIIHFLLLFTSVTPYPESVS